MVARDRAADGTFVYSVRTTGVFCRPSCGSKRANPANVRFHETVVAAEQAGFRPCLRCRPDQPSTAERYAGVVAEACRAIDAADDSPSLQALADRAALSPHHFHRVFRAVTGLTPRGYALAARARRLRSTLASSATVTEAIYDAGFGSSGRFYATSDRVLGMAPRAYRAGGAQLEITWATSPCSLGLVLVGRTIRGVCAVLLGDDGDDLAAELAKRFPRARLRAESSPSARVVAAVVALVDAPQTGALLPLDLYGTVFQQRVWRALQEIPPGTTVSYGELADRIGAPSSVRAVARACGANPLAVVVPCHRVVGRDGALTGYRWGTERKKALIERERRSARRRSEP